MFANLLIVEGYAQHTRRCADCIYNPFFLRILFLALHRFEENLLQFRILFEKSSNLFGRKLGTLCLDHWGHRTRQKQGDDEKQQTKDGLHSGAVMTRNTETNRISGKRKLFCTCTCSSLVGFDTVCILCRMADLRDPYVSLPPWHPWFSTGFCHGSHSRSYLLTTL